MGRVDGIHFPTSQDMSTALLGVLDPTSTTVMNEPEARWHYNDMHVRFPEALIVWRASPDKKPADLGWDAHAYSREIYRSLDFHADRHDDQYPTDILLLNELNLDYERGEDHHDGGAFDTNPENWPSLYGQIARFLTDLLFECRERARDRGIKPRFWFPAWAPGHGEQNSGILAIWKPVAEQYDGVCFHAYGASEPIQDAIWWYSGQFPNHPLLLGEWNTDGLPEPERIPEEAFIREMLRYQGEAFSNLSACYFIWAWAQDLGRKSYDIEGNDARLAVWDGRVPIPSPGPTPEPTPEPIPEPAPEEPPVPVSDALPRGIDIANYQGYPDWTAVRDDGVEFAFIKATEGTGYVNETFSGNWPQISEVGIKRAAYHFARPDLNLPEDEAQFFWSVVQAQGVAVGDVFAVDIEDFLGSLKRARLPVAQWTLRWLQAFQALSDTRAMLYINRSDIIEYGFSQYPEFAEFGLWFAAWIDSFPPVPAPWDVIAVWQAHAEGQVAGISGKVDTDYFNGPIEAFPKYGYQSGAPEPAPLPEPAPEPEPTPAPPDLSSVLGYLTHDVADALEKEVMAIRASLDALQAAIDQIRRQIP